MKRLEGARTCRLGGSSLSGLDISALKKKKLKMNPVYTCTVKDDTRWRIVSAYFPFVVSVFNVLQPFSDTFILSRSLWIVSHIVSSRLFNNTIQGIKRCVL